MVHACTHIHIRIQIWEQQQPALCFLPCMGLFSFYFFVRVCFFVLFFKSTEESQFQSLPHLFSSSLIISCLLFEEEAYVSLYIIAQAMNKLSKHHMRYSLDWKWCHPCFFFFLCMCYFVWCEICLCVCRYVCLCVDSSS